MQPKRAGEAPSDASRVTPVLHGPKLRGRGPPRLGFEVAATQQALLTVRQVAAVLGVSKAIVYGLIERGELAHTRVVNSVRVSRGALNAYLLDTLHLRERST